MTPSTIIALFSGAQGGEEAREYLEVQGLFTILAHLAIQATGRIQPSYQDLARLHAVIRNRRVFSVLEFGIGYSTLVMADALAKNRCDWDILATKPSIRCSTPFQLHAVDTEKHWIDIALDNLPIELVPYVKTLHTGVRSAQYRGMDCHLYDQIPDVVPDLIYLDGPCPSAVRSESPERTAWGNPDRVILAADILKIEPWLLPGTLLMVDGRQGNVRFIKGHLYRNWFWTTDELTDVSVF